MLPSFYKSGKWWDYTVGLQGWGYNVIDWCDDIDDKSSVYYNSDKFHPIPDKLEEDNIWYTSDELEESNDKESGIREYKYSFYPEKTTMCGKKKKIKFF